MKKKTIKGYKVFNSDFTCRGFQFEEGKDYKYKEVIEIYKSGFHFCTIAAHCFSYYEFDPKNIVCEVEALGNTKTHQEDSKVVTDHIKILKILSWGEVLKVSNLGIENTGHSNAGNYNAGDYNAGNRNAGDRNAGNRNAGYSNAGNYNAGNRNAGYSNAGNYNAGYYNAGDRNAGNYNAGNYNAGDRNAGYSNAGNDNAGAFNTSEEFRLFNKKSKWNFENFKNSKAFKLLHTINTTFWISTSHMSEQDKKENPYYIINLGYNKIIPYKESFSNAWNNWSEEDKKAFTSLPNFDWTIFEKITSVKKP